jgi:hypothetical protein
MRSSSCLVMLEVPSALRQGSTHELVNEKLIMLSNARCAIGEVTAKVDARGGAGGLRCHASSLHPQQYNINTACTLLSYLRTSLICSLH